MSTALPPSEDADKATGSYDNIIKSALREITHSVNQLCRLLNKSEFNANLGALVHIARDYEHQGAAEIEFYDVEVIDTYSKATQIDAIRRILLPTLRTHDQPSANRLVGTVVINCSPGEEKQFISLLNSINAAKDSIISELNEHFPKMHYRMAYINSRGTPLYSMIMSTVRRKVVYSNAADGVFIKSVTFNWSEKSYKQYTIKNKEMFDNHLSWYGGEVYAGKDKLWYENPLAKNEKWVTFLPQRVHPVANITYADCKTQKVLKRLPLKAHTPIFLFSSNHSKVKMLKPYELVHGLKKVDQRYIPIRPDLSLYKLLDIKKGS